MFHEKLQEARKHSGMSQQEVADALGIRRQTYSAYERGVSLPDPHVLRRLAGLYAVTVDWLLETEEAAKDAEVSCLRVPVYGQVAAGIPMEAIENIIDYEEVEPHSAAGGTLMALRIKGDSMEPKFSDGDVVIVRRQPDVENGEIAVVMTNGDCATVKRVIKHRDGIALMPTNPAYAPMFFTNSEIESLPVTVVGKVIELRAKF